MLNLNLNIVGAGQRSNIGAGPDVGPTTTTTTTTSTTTTSTTTSTTTTTAAPVSFRTDPYSASLQLALPGAVFPSLGVTDYRQDVSELIRGTGTGYSVQNSYIAGPGSIIQNGLINPAPKWVANSYSSSMRSTPQSFVVQANSATIGYNNSLTSSQFTIETWVNTTAWDSIFGATEVYRAYSGGPLLFTLQSNPQSGSNPQIETILIRNDGSEFIYIASPYLLQTGSWYHTAVVRDGNNYNMLLNGEVVSKFTNSATLKIGEIPQIIGTVSNDYIQGVVTASFQDFRLYSGPGAAKYAIQESGSTYTTPQSMIV